MTNLVPYLLWTAPPWECHAPPWGNHTWPKIASIIQDLLLLLWQVSDLWSLLWKVVSRKSKLSNFLRPFCGLEGQDYVFPERLYSAEHEWHAGGGSGPRRRRRTRGSWWTWRCGTSAVHQIPTLEQWQGSPETGIGSGWGEHAEHSAPRYSQPVLRKQGLVHPRKFVMYFFLP